MFMAIIPIYHSYIPVIIPIFPYRLPVRINVLLTEKAPQDFVAAAKKHLDQEQCAPRKVLGDWGSAKEGSL